MVNKEYFDENHLRDSIKGKRVLFISAKNLNYIRNVQYLKLIKEESGSFKIIGSNNSNYFLRILWVYYQLLFINSKQFDLIMVGYFPQFILPLWKWRFNHKPIIIDFCISVYDTLVFDRYKLSPINYLARLIKRLDLMTLRCADQVIIETKSYANYFQDIFIIPNKKITILYLQANSEIYQPTSKKPGKLFRAIYYGSVLPLHGVDVILEAAKILESNKNIKFVIIGPTPYKLRNRYESLQNIEFIPWLSDQEISNQINQSSLGLAGHYNANSSKAKLTVPGKTYTFIAMNKAIIVGDNQANREVFGYKNTLGVYFVKMSDPNALSKMILQVSNTNRLAEPLVN